ncbi:AI-2E family transporter [Sanguibacter sp. 26GB23]|uniref:AI-2E family transporter n=1 Tax=Sanguibacter sp. 26GB23 TaxID=3156066 RepID=UPI0032AED305
MGAGQDETDGPTTPDEGTAHSEGAGPSEGTRLDVSSDALGASTRAVPRSTDLVPRSIQSVAAWSWRLVAIVLGAACVVWLVSYLKVLVVAVAVALLLTVLLQPFARVLRTRLYFSPVLASATALVALLAGVVGLVVVAGLEIASGLADLGGKAEQGIQQLLDALASGPLHLDSDEIDGYLDEMSSAVQGGSSSVASGALTVTTTVTEVLSGGLIALFCTFFFLFDGRRIWTWIVGLLPRHARERTHQAGRRGLVTLASYVRTQILVAFIDGLGVGIGAAIIGVPLAVPLGVLVFLGAFVPLVGAVVTGAVAVLVALVANGWVTALIMLGVVLLVQQIEGHVLQPWLMGHAVSLHPVAVVLVVTGGTLVAGILGALFAVPLAAVLNTVVLYFHGHDKFPELGFEDHVSLRPSGRRAVMITAAARHVGEPGPTTRLRT